MGVIVRVSEAVVEFGRGMVRKDSGEDERICVSPKERKAE